MNTRSILPLASALGIFATSSANAAMALVNVSADGDVQTFGGDSVDTLDNALTTTQSGLLQRHIILEFDLSSIPDGSTVNSVVLNLTKEGGFSNTTDSIQLHLLAYNGDGTVDITDYSAAGTNVGNPAISLLPSIPANGTTYAFGFTSVAPVQTALDTVNKLLSVRIETDNFATANFTSSDSTSGFDSPTLNIDYTAPIPEPSSTALFALGGLAGCLHRRRPRA